MEPGVEFYTALAKARHEMGKVVKSKKGQVGSQPYKYADLLAVAEATDDVLFDNGLLIWFSAGDYSNGCAHMEYELVHFPTSQKISRLASMPCDQKAQAVGSAHTYLRRYIKFGLLDMVTEDDDGKAASQERRGSPSMANVARDIAPAPSAVSRPSQEPTGAFTLAWLKDYAKSKEISYPTIGLVGAYLSNPQSDSPKAVDEGELASYQEANEGITPLALLVHAADWYAQNGKNEKFRAEAEQWMAERS